MAKKFIRVNGLHNIFDSENNTYDTQILSESADRNVVNEYSICFITADDTDYDLNHIYAGTYIWAKGVLFPCKDTEELKQTVNNLVVDVENLTSEVSHKQNTLSAGSGIQISANTISVINDFLPIGSITMWATATPPTGWLICDGQSITASTYSALSEVLNADVVPDLTGRFPLGAGNSGEYGSTGHTLGETGGEEKHLLTTGETPVHNHEIKTLYHRVGGIAGDYRTFNLNDMNISPTTSDIETLNPTDFTEDTGGGQSHNNMPPYFTLNFIIKYK